jgi:hypothetical protein
MKKDINKIALFFRVFKRKCVKLYDDFNHTEPMVKSEAVENTLYLLGRDFKPDEQNEIILNLIQRLHEKRESELIKLENELKELRAQTNILKVKLVMRN